MKKIFLPLLALVGMVTGFTLTSCGGGGGGHSLEGTTIYATGNGFSYLIHFHEKVGSAYQGTLTDYEGDIESSVTINISQCEVTDGEIDILEGELSVASFEAEKAEAMYRLFVGEVTDDEGNVVEISFNGSPSFKYAKPAPDSKQEFGKLVWTVDVNEAVVQPEDEEEETIQPEAEPAQEHTVYEITRG